jgi:hypothetical protein
MPTATRREKMKFAREQYKKGVTAPAKLQSMLKKKFGSGMSFMDLGSIFPKKPGAKKKKAAKKAAKKRGRPASRPRKKTGRRGRPAGATRDQWLVAYGDEGETVDSKTQVQAKVSALISEGVSVEDITVYQKTSLKLTVKTAITL